MNKITRHGLIAVLIFSLIAGACAGAAETVEPVSTELPADIGTLQVGYIPILGFVPFFVAQEKGYFAEQGLTVELQSFRTGDDMIAPLSLGQLDVGGGETGPALFNAIDQKLDVKVVMSLAAQPPGYGAVPLLVRKALLDSGEVSQVSDLAGRKVALNVERGMAEYLLAKALEKAGLTVDDVDIVTLPFPEVPQALANEAVDAAILPHPLAATTLRPGENGEPPIAGVLLEGDQIADSPQNGAMYFGTRLLDPKNREVAVRFLMAVLKAVREVQGDAWRTNDQIVAAIQKYTNVPEPAIRNGVAYYFNPNGTLITKSTEDIQAYHVGRGYTEFDTPLPMDQIFTPAFVNETLARMGEVEVK